VDGGTVFVARESSYADCAFPRRRPTTLFFTLGKKAAVFACIFGGDML
jgi:hypothetical protein